MLLLLDAACIHSRHQRKNGMDNFFLSFFGGGGLQLSSCNAVLLSHQTAGEILVECWKVGQQGYVFSL